jgi:hypothetical protein
MKQIVTVVALLALVACNGIDTCADWNNNDRCISGGKSYEIMKVDGTRSYGTVIDTKDFKYMWYNKDRVIIESPLLWRNARIDAIELPK